MRKRHYESVVILNATLEDNDIESSLNRIQETLTTNGAEITELEKWGRKRLAYPIQKSKSGYYVVYRFLAPAEAITELERMYRLDENVVRFLTIVLGKKDLEHIEKVKAKKDEKISEEVAEAKQNNESKDNQSSD